MDERCAPKHIIAECRTTNQRARGTGGQRRRRAAMPPALSLPGRGAAPGPRRHLDKLPKQMVVAIDGQARTGKNTAGELVAEAIGGLLVNSGRFYRALTKAALRGDINWGMPRLWRPSAREPSWRFAGGFRRRAGAGGFGFGKWRVFQQGGVGLGRRRHPANANVQEARDVVNRLLRDFRGAGCVVMLGRDIGARVFPDTPFKFFLNAPEAVLEDRQLQTTGVPGVWRTASLPIAATPSSLKERWKSTPRRTRLWPCATSFWRRFTATGRDGKNRSSTTRHHRRKRTSASPIPANRRQGPQK